MASVSAPRSESHATNLDARPLSPIQNGQIPSRLTTTPRPSISPLSSASKTHRSPVAKRSVRDTDTSPSRGGIRNGLFHAEGESGIQHDDRSSSLSEPEYDPDEDELQHDGDHMTLRHGLSYVQKSLEVDSEAETERLETTPQKAWKRNGDIGKTPTKLGQSINAKDMFSDPASPTVSNADIDSASISGSFGGHKRKRSESVESPLSSAASDVGESPRKRVHESSGELDHDVDARVTAGNGLEGRQTRGANIDEEADDLALESAVQLSPRKVFKGRKGKYKTRKTNESRENSTPTQPDEGLEDEDDLGIETSAKTEEEMKYKGRAMELFENLARQFTSFKEKLYTERLDGLSRELRMLAQPLCEHPEYLRQISAISARMEKQSHEAHAFYRYRLQCIRERTLAERSQIHSQFFQEVRDIRERTMNRLGEDWYNIQKERRQSHQEKDAAYVYLFPSQKSVQIRQQAKYNQEVSVLSGIAKYVGFPAAPDILGAQGDSLESDLKAMKISKRVAQPITHSRAVLFHKDASSALIQSERLAHDQYLEQNAWARPQAPIQQHGTPNLTHTPDWADHPGQTRNVGRNPSSQVQPPNDSFSTPDGRRTAAGEPPSSETLPLHSDGLMPPFSTQPLPGSGNRGHQYRAGSLEQGSPLNITKQRQITADPGNFRNFSNISRVSGASTIDAPSESERDRESQNYTPLTSKTNVMETAFDAGRAQHQSTNGKDSGFSSQIQEQEGAFGTPAPLASTGK